MRNAKRAAAALTLAAAALAVTGPASADEAPREGGQINLPDDPGEVVDGVRTGLDVAAMAWETAARSR
ncbi:hypothetical protein [Streptomyces longisporoflavus]|uniref:Secreted protein n=1 Tax=Streptomyces longisporoflavus TaxID=28044 RepID=A0ABW7QRG4_9ACTN